MALFQTSKEKQGQNYNQAQGKTDNKQGYVRKMLSKTDSSKLAENDQQDESEQKIEKILGRARPSFIVELIKKGDELTQEDLEIIEEVQQHMEEEQKEVVEEEKVDSLLCTLSHCYISGCVVHTLMPGFVHYAPTRLSGYPSVSSMDDRTKKGYEYYKKNPGCSCVEVYERHICVVGGNGITKVINE